MKLYKLAIATVAVPALLVTNMIGAQATSFSPLTTINATTISALAAATLAASSGISIVGGSETYVGASGQGGTYSGFSISNGSTTISNGDGVILTTGDGSPPLTNTLSNFSVVTGSGSTAALEAELTAAGAPSSTTNDSNVLSFSFTVGAGITSVSGSFVFGTDEFPDQLVTDIFAVFIDGVNFAKFQDGSLVTFLDGSPNEAFFNDNTDGAFALEYDGITDRLIFDGILNSALTIHTFSLAIADTADSIFDSGVFFSGLVAGEVEGGGGIVNVIPLPPSAILMLTGLFGLGAISRRHKAKRLKRKAS